MTISECVRQGKIHGAIGQTQPSLDKSLPLRFLYYTLYMVWCSFLQRQCLLTDLLAHFHLDWKTPPERERDRRDEPSATPKLKCHLQWPQRRTTVSSHSSLMGETPMAWVEETVRGNNTYKSQACSRQKQNVQSEGEGDDAVVACSTTHLFPAALLCTSVSTLKNY